MQARGISWNRGWFLLLFASLAGVAGILVAARLAGISPIEWRLGRTILILAGSVWIALLGFFLAQALLSLRSGFCAVARLLLLESTRKRSVPVTLAIVLFLIAALARGRYEETQLHYHLRGFLTYSIEITALAFSLLTLFLGCGSVAGEVGGLQIYFTLVKPIPRASYLLGKWLGILLLNLICLASVGFAIGSFAVAELHMAPRGAISHTIAEEEVVTARRGVKPSPQVPLEDLARAEWLKAGLPPIPVEQMDERALDKWREYMRGARGGWLKVDPGERETYVFRGLEPAELAGDDVTLRVRIKMRYSPFRVPSDLAVKLIFSGAGIHEERRVLNDEVLRLQIPSARISNGTLRVTIENPDAEAPALFLSGAEDFEVFHAGGSFAANLARGLLLLWLKLAFLATLALFSATFLGFPVAILFASMVAASAASSGFILEGRTSGHAHAHAAAHGSTNEDARADVRLIERVVDLLDDTGKSVASTLVAFSRYDPAQRIAGGRMVEWREVGRCARLLGGLWCGLLWVGAILIFRRRELARVQV